MWFWQRSAPFFYFSRSLHPSLSLSLFLSRLVKMRWAHCSVIVEARGAAAFRATGSTTCAPRYGVSNLIHQRKGRRKCVQIIAIDRHRRLGHKKKKEKKTMTKEALSVHFRWRAKSITNFRTKKDICYFRA